MESDNKVVEDGRMIRRDEKRGRNVFNNILYHQVIIGVNILWPMGILLVLFFFAKALILKHELILLVEP